MPYVPYKNGTLLIPSGNSEHLFVIVTDVCPAGSHLLVNFCSIKPQVRYDATCIVNPGEHPFIKHPSYMLYRMAEIQPAARLTKMVEGWMYKPGEDATDALVAKIRAGVAASRFTPQRIVDYCNNAP